MRKFLAVLVLLALLYVAVGMVLTPHTTATSASASRYSVAGQPTIPATKIDSILCSALSPACGTGAQLYQRGVAAGIDPVYALAFFRHESSYGKYGVARATLGLGNIRCSAGYSCIGGFRAYATWDQGYQDWYSLIRYYVNSWHKATIEQIVPTYAPSSENDTSGYIAAIEQSVDEWRG